MAEIKIKNTFSIFENELKIQQGNLVKIMDYDTIPLWLN